MNVASHKRPLPLSSRPRNAWIRGVNPAPRSHSGSWTATQRISSVTPVMGPPNRAPGVPVMGATSWDIHLHLMGRPDAGTRVDPLGGPDNGPRVDPMGESDLSFVDWLFTQRSAAD